MDTLGIPIISYLKRIRFGDHREEIAEYSKDFVKNAPISIISVLNIKNIEKRGLRGDDFSAPQYRWYYCYEAGACAQNTLLVASAWGLTGNITQISNLEKTNSLLRLNNNYLPLFVMPLGYPIS